MQYAKSAAFDKAENLDLVTLYNEMILHLHRNLNPLKYAIITVLVSRQFPDLEEAIKFLGAAAARLEEKKDAAFLCRIG